MSTPAQKLMKVLETRAREHARHQTAQQRSHIGVVIDTTGPDTPTIRVGAVTLKRASYRVGKNVKLKNLRRNDEVLLVKTASGIYVLTETIRRASDSTDDSRIDGDLFVEGTVEANRIITNILNLTGDLNLGEDLTIAGDASVGDDLTVTGDVAGANGVYTGFVTVGFGGANELKFDASSFQAIGSGTNQGVSIKTKGTGAFIVNDATGAGTGGFQVFGGGGSPALAFSVSAAGAVSATGPITITGSGDGFIDRSAAATTTVLFAGKVAGDSFDRIQITADGRIWRGGGTVAPAYIIGRGLGSPEGAITASPGSVWQRIDGGTTEAFYLKVSGTGSTGWEKVWSGDLAWSGLSFASGWTNYGAGSYESCEYTKGRDGQIYLQGLAKRTSGSGMTIGTLPSGFRPAVIPTFIVSVLDTTFNWGVVQIDGSGNITVAVPTSIASNTTNYVSLAGIRFEPA